MLKLKLVDGLDQGTCCDLAGVVVRDAIVCCLSSTFPVMDGLAAVGIRNHDPDHIFEYSCRESLNCGFYRGVL